MRKKMMMVAAVTMAAVLSPASRSRAEAAGELGPLATAIAESVPSETTSVSEITAFLDGKFLPGSPALKELQQSAFCREAVSSLASITGAALGQLGPGSKRCITALAQAIAMRRPHSVELAGLQARSSSCANALAGCRAGIARLGAEVADLRAQVAQQGRHPLLPTQAAGAPPDRQSGGVGTDCERKEDGTLVCTGEAAQVAPLFAGAAERTCAAGFDALVKDPDVVLTPIGDGKYRVAFKNGGFTCVTSERVAANIPIMPTDDFGTFRLSPPAGRLPGASPPSPPPAPSGWCGGSDLCKAGFYGSLAAAAANVVGAAISFPKGGVGSQTGWVNVSGLVLAGVGALGFYENVPGVGALGLGGSAVVIGVAANRGAYHVQVR